MEYSFEFVGGVNNSYTIVTTSEVVYEIKFKPSQYLSKLNNFEENLIFEFIIEVLYRPENIALTLDKYLAPTICKVFHDFYNLKNDSVTVYICDSSDGRHYVRKRKFDNWFDEFNDNSFVKFDDIILDKENNEFPIAFILKKANPNFNKICEDFINTINENNEDKLR
jgi:intracellular sulfur oxidation DsrE/DsrF family protein